MNPNQRKAIFAAEKDKNKKPAFGTGLAQAMRGQGKGLVR